MANVLRKKTVGMDALRRRDRDRQGNTTRGTSSSSSNNSIHTVISSPSPTTTSVYSQPFHSSASSRTPKVTRPSTNMPMASGPITIDLHRFADEHLQPQEIVKQLLGNASEEDVRGFHKALVEAKQTVGGDLQRNVYRNYTEFVSISKEIANLDGDVMHLKMYLNEVRGIWQSFLTMSDQLDQGDAIKDDEIILSTRKPSDLKTADTQSVYKAQLTALWENVEESQKFVKYAPSRHIIREFAHFIELDPRTEQARRHVHLFLLNDCLLVAARKNRSMSTKNKLVAMYCWNILDIRMIERTNSNGIVAGVDVYVGNRIFAYRSDRPEEGSSLFHSFTRLLDDNELNILGQTNGESNFRDVVKPPSEVKPGQSKDIKLDDEDQQWLEILPDELEVMIALRRFEEAVTCITKARGILSIYSNNPPPLIRDSLDKVAKYTDSLGATICNDLGNPLLTKLQFQRYVDWLLRLDKGEKAREVFLSTRSLIIKKRIRQLTFEGDTTTYINELALVVFTLIRNTCEWYRDSFKLNAMSSGFVTWVREQTEIYAEIYKRQVFYQNQLGCQVIADCFKSTLDQCSMLRKVGLDLKFLLEDLFLDNIKETVFAYEKKVGSKIDKFVQNDNYTTVSSQNLGPDVKVTSSVVGFYNILVKFVHDICLIAKLQLYTTVIDCVSRLTEHYLRSMLNESQKRDLSKDQRSAALMNVSFVLDNVIPRVSSQFNYQFDRPIPELDSLRARLRELTYRK
ncbi:uncharacterized protein BX664DRAFT_280848 [Halteromyces radiatus]|uniref:uncharacterized protein n=1 Tax=Halteromyces radiatus TaxID=101107 RepID=UPI00221EE7C0|nr:uncharacterized protein BX664DRAFT_280848 [Halteromyces radiatus]KAI8089706.1 hypothetical protein BX664DRAFT_280848 [Halteromyces radiatus]